MSRHSQRQHRYCVILAGGDGTRLRSLTRCVSTDERPKQFCPFLFGRTPLRAARRRAARSVAPERTLVVVTRTHERYYTDELSDFRPAQLLIQPSNRGTAPAILLSLLHLNRIDPDASVVFLPSDHYYRDEGLFIDGVQRAFEAAEVRTCPAILVGASPTHPEVGFGWIEPGTPLEAEGPIGLSRVKRFWEKPSLPVAQILLNLGCLWNTFVMVGRVSAFLDMIRTATPGLYDEFQRHAAVFGPFDSEQLYADLAPVDFSRDILAGSPSNLAVLDAGSVGWSDLGEPERVAKLISQLDSQCDWLRTWRRASSAAVSCRRAPRNLLRGTFPPVPGDLD
jgi:mannose-1-phosphate guanylyltransferase